MSNGRSCAHWRRGCPLPKIWLPRTCAFDRQTPLHVKAALIGAIAYFVLPADVVPDVLPVIGYTDDAAMLAGAIKLVASHITPDHREAARRKLADMRSAR
jgi:uncharacterized membrane protein YkvA (DUF1232 family)